MATPLAPDELKRYARHLTLPEVGIEGQLRLRGARVLCVGAGGLGSPIALYLAAAGVGTLGLVDFDVVDLSNLQRQILHGTPDVGRSKLASAVDRLRAVNPGVAVRPFEARLTRENAPELLRDFDLVVDGTDNFPTRYLVNDECVLAGKPWVYGSVFRFEGQVAVFGAPGGPCYRCLYPAPPPPGLVPSCAEGGVLGVLPGLVGTLQATEALKLILGVGEPLVGRLLLVDALGTRFRELRVRPDPRCPACGTRTVREPIGDEAFCAAPREERPVSPAVPEIQVEELKRALDGHEDLLVVDVREPHEHALCNLGGRLVPLGELPGRLEELDPGRDIVVLCRSGVRSARAVALLRQAGFARVRNVAGGILAWAERIDPSMPRY